MKPYDPFEGLRKLDRLATIAWVLCVIPFVIVGGLLIAALLIEGHV